MKQEQYKIHTITQVSLSPSLSLNLSLTPLPLLPIFSTLFPPFIPFLLSLYLSHDLSHKASSFSQHSSPPIDLHSHVASSFPFPLQPSLSISLPSPPHSHMASWFSQDNIYKLHICLCVSMSTCMHT